MLKHCNTRRTKQTKGMNSNAIIMSPLNETRVRKISQMHSLHEQQAIRLIISRMLLQFWMSLCGLRRKILLTRVSSVPSHILHPNFLTPIARRADLRKRQHNFCWLFKDDKHFIPRVLFRFLLTNSTTKSIIAPILCSYLTFVYPINTYYLISTKLLLGRHEHDTLNPV